MIQDQGIHLLGETVPIFTCDLSEFRASTSAAATRKLHVEMLERSQTPRTYGRR
jgi:hypothetical protein